MGRKLPKSVATAGPRVVPRHQDKGLRIYQARTAARLTQGELGARLGVAARTVGRWEVGRFAPPKRIRAALLTALADAGAESVDAVAVALEMQAELAARAGVLDEALRTAGEIADAKPSAIRAAVLHVLTRAGERGLTLGELRARLAPLPRQARPARKE